MSNRNVFETMQAELDLPNESHVVEESSDDESSEDEYVPSESSDSEEDVVEEDLRERADEEEDNSNDTGAQVLDLTGKDGTVWQSTPPATTRTQQHNIVRSRAKPTNLPGVLTDIAQAFQLYLNDKIVVIIITYTNMEADKVYDQRCGDKKWKPTDRTEILAYIGLVITAGHLKQNYVSLHNLWDHKYGPPIFRATMPKYRFIALTRFMRFDNKETQTARRAEDKLAPIRELFNEINTLLLRYYTPSEYLTVDEQLVPFKGRCPFRQYIPSKPDKYGMKIFWICDAKSFYPLKAKPYLGKEKSGPQQNLGRSVVLELTNPFTYSGRNITMDNYFTDMVLAKSLLQNGLTLVGTVRKNKKFIPSSCLPSRSREEKSSIFAFQQKCTLVSYVPKKK